MSTRIRGEVFNKLSEAARRNDRPLGQEVELRVEGSFRQQEFLEQALELAYGRKATALLLILMREITWQGFIGAAISAGFSGETEAHGNLDRAIGAVAKNWLDDPFGYSQAAKAAGAILEKFKPAGDPNTLKNGTDATAFAERYAPSLEITLAAIKDPNWGKQFSDQDRNIDLEEFAAKIRRLAPELVERLAASKRPRGRGGRR